MSIKRGEKKFFTPDLKQVFETVAENTYDMERWVLPDGTLAYISPSCERITGYSRAEHMADPRLFYKIIHPDDRERFAEQMKLNFHADKDGVNDFRITTNQGELKWVNIAATMVTDQNGNDLGLRISTRDVTEAVNVKTELKISEARYKAVVESQYELIVRHDPDGNISFVNNAFLKFTGLYDHEVQHVKWFELLEPEISKKIRKLMSEMTFESPAREITLEMKRRDGESRWFKWSSTALFGLDKKLSEYQVVGHDITELAESERKLKSALEELSRLKNRLEDENVYLKSTFLPSKSMDNLVSISHVMNEVISKIYQVSATDAPVLIMGETGTGKELVAQSIHNQSKRKRRLMITVNCGALPSTLIESELFGREKGAYTGALAKQIGRFELADHSTIFLDEIGELPPETQVKLLRILQCGEFQMLGSPETRKVDVRVIAATNRDLTKAVADGAFRSDLFYRLNVFPIYIPPLRERKEDIPGIAFNFIDEIGQRMGKRIEGISQAGMKKLIGYDWPGNVRELRNIIEYSMILNQGSVLEIVMHDVHPGSNIDHSLDERQRQHILSVLKQTGWKIRGIGGAAEKLGMKESTLRFRIKKLGISRE